MRPSPLTLTLALCALAHGCGASSQCLAGRTCGDARWLAEGSVIDGRRVVAQAVSSASVGSPAGNSRSDAMRVSSNPVFLRFDLSALGDATVIDRAVLALSPHPAWRASSRGSRLVARSIASAWTVARVASADAPTTGETSTEVTLPAGVRGPLRVDVTSIVQAWRARTSPEEGLALEVDGGDAVFAGVGAATLADRPRLEVVVR